MIEGFAPGSLIVVNLVNPKEKFFGILGSLSPAGVTMRGINLDSFDDWMRHLSRDEEPGIDLVTMFFPLFRVERIFLDEPSAGVPSLGQRFAAAVHMTVQEFVSRD